LFEIIKLTVKTLYKHWYKTMWWRK